MFETPLHVHDSEMTNQSDEHSDSHQSDGNESMTHDFVSETGGRV